MEEGFRHSVSGAYFVLSQQFHLAARVATDFPALDASQGYIDCFAAVFA